jgi:hypothetical protein
VSNTTHTAAGTYSTDYWTFTGAGNYNNIAATTITDTINKANAMVVVTPYTVTYDGNPHTATVTSITGVAGQTGATVGTVDVSNTTHTNAATYNADFWTFTGTANYNNIGATTITDTINKAVASVTADNKTKMYGAVNPALTATVVGAIVGGDPVNYTLATTATQFSSMAGNPYPITVTLGSNPNYTVTPTNGSLTITTAFCFNGFLPPIGGAVENVPTNGGTCADPVRAFKLGSTIPVKFILNAVSGSGCGGLVTTGVHTLQAIYYSPAMDAEPPIDATPTDAATPGNEFRLTGTEWHFNLSTKGGFKAGTWQLKATLQDGSTKTVWISVKK